MSLELDFVYPASYTRFVSEGVAPTDKKTGRPDLDWFIRSKSELGVIPDKFLRDLLVPFFVHGDRRLVSETKAA